jgi:hypothetical protein
MSGNERAIQQLVLREFNLEVQLLINGFGFGLLPQSG